MSLKGNATHGGGAGSATDPVNLDGATRVGVGDICSQLSTRATVYVWVGGTLDRAICVDLTDDRADRWGRPHRIALVSCTVDGDLVDVAVGRDKCRKEKREKGGRDHDGISN